MTAPAIPRNGQTADHHGNLRGVFTPALKFQRPLQAPRLKKVNNTPFARVMEVLKNICLLPLAILAWMFEPATPTASSSRSYDNDMYQSQSFVAYVAYCLFSAIGRYIGRCLRQSFKEWLCDFGVVFVALQVLNWHYCSAIIPNAGKERASAVKTVVPGQAVTESNRS